MRPFRALVAVEALPLTAAGCVLIVFLLAGSDAALPTVFLFLLVGVSGRHILRWAISSGRTVDDTGLTLAFLDSDLLRKNTRRQDWAAVVMVLGYTLLIFVPCLSLDELIIAGAALWTVLGSLRLRVLIAFLGAELNGSTVNGDTAQSSDSVAPGTL